MIAQKLCQTATWYCQQKLQVFNNPISKSAARIGNTSFRFHYRLFDHNSKDVTISNSVLSSHLYYHVLLMFSNKFDNVLYDLIFKSVFRIRNKFSLNKFLGFSRLFPRTYFPSPQITMILMTRSRYRFFLS